MQVYIFRVLAEDEESFLREIALSEDNTLLDFHNTLTKSMRLDDKQLASFYLTNKQWEKQKEFTLMDMDVEDYTAEKQNDDMIPIEVMSNVHIGDIVEDPKQRMLYEYGFFQPSLFFISLINTEEADDNTAFPKILQMEGNIDIEQMAMFGDKMEDELLEDLMEEGYDEDDFDGFGFEGDDLYDDYGGDSFDNNDY
ncbi:MAG: plasmid pRiA4b ORF-3 family protein [Bacteroidales bacterium]|nr:plasmid pRiA4b ORF-3 family protein [Bacteroidales bacterium]